MTGPRHDISQLDDALAFLTDRKARYHVLDSLACYLHNDGYALDGNTEESDVEWFARNLWEREHERSGRWEQAPEEEKTRFIRLAQMVIAELPAFQLRIAHRLITLSKIVRDIERAERHLRAEGASDA